MLVPHRLAALERCAAHEATRYAMNGVRVMRLAFPDGNNGNLCRAEATDGRRLIRAEWCSSESDMEQYPPMDGNGFSSVPQPSFDAIVPNSLWRGLAKLVKTKASTHAILRNTWLDEHANNGDPHGPKVRIAGTDCEETVVKTARRLEGEFPQTDAVWPKGEGQAKSCVMDARMLADTLKALVDATDSAGYVELIFHGEEAPMVLRMIDATGPEVTGLQMPVNK